MNQYQEKILHLATAVRSRFAEKEDSVLENQEQYFKKSKAIYQQSHSGLSEETSSGVWNTRDETEMLKEYFEADVTKWSQAFSKLRPPPNITKKRQSQSSLKLTNKSCKKILQIVGSYSENYESEKECKDNYEVEYKPSVSDHKLWDVDDAMYLETPEDDIQLEFPKYREKIIESNESPIPRSLTNF